MAGRHRKNPHHRGRHRKPASPARIAIPLGTGVAVIVASAVVFNHADANGQPPPLTPSVAVAATDPRPSVLAFHTTKPVVRHVAAPPVHRHQARGRRSLQRHNSPVAFRVRAISDCYLQVTNHGGKLLVRRILHRGEHVAFRHHGLHVVLGNAGGVRISIDGQRPRLAGASGAVRRFPVA
jgi:hypothetical protein